MVSGEKRNCEEGNTLENISAILLDIEGTTTSISFVKDTLFPYVRENLNSYVESHWDNDEFKEDLKALKSQAKKDAEDKIENFCPIEEGEQEKESLIKNVLWQMDLDRKTTALKQLQGHIWRDGYANGKLKSHFYDDVPEVLKKWCESGRKLYVYSSGSVEAQKLLFKNSEYGDLSEFLSGYFDTNTGLKTEASSYISIAKTIECDAAQILFLTDVVKEAVAADKAGFQVMLVIREGNAPITDDEKKAFTTIITFKDIVFESANKKKKICEENRLEGEDIKHDEEVKEPSEVKNGEPEQMEVENTDAKTEELKTEETEQNKTEVKTTTESPESENIDVDDSNVNDKAEEKTVSSSSVGENESKNGSNSVESTENTDVAENVEVADSVKVTASIEENDVKEGEVTNGDEKSEMEAEKQGENGEVSVNGHENAKNKENNEENGEEPVKESKSDETNGKLEEIEAIPVKKVTGEEQADSTVEVTA